MKAVVFGGGSIGRGFLGQLLSQSGFETVFVDVNEALISGLNERHSYPIRVVSNEKQYDIMVQNVRAVHSDNAPAEVADADILFTSAGVNVLPHIAPVIERGLALRDKGVDIVICENLMDADSYLRGLIKTDLPVGFVEASVGRMVPVMTDEMRAADPLCVWVEPFCTLYVDKDAFQNPIPDIRGMQPDAPFSYYIQSKLYLHNMGHALAAYMGMQKGYTYIWEAMEDADIAACVKDAMYASAEALSLEHGRPFETVKAYADDLMQRFCNRYLGDTTKRVGRDTRRKLMPDDRFLGAIQLCQKHHISTDAIKRGVMAALDYLYEQPAG